ncbi:uncharacterized protein PHACADRAFT_167688 [Phanerochaete carnosa HHB-10118-sp]|uniref:4-hydroxybenzoate polyprenyltransferase, mitochondrial n=1 Tax=Phanerochaete carnosa (strain HHB-10118-sp) TaxID=650164 RepID=K5WMC1_PHACS|nr:uncharacterized protein PHACADRAFT_167688 [Phanerochaete carnosa HHB-10118-sp]EKM60304.1 hypothetical protein PHACADRAFT_167688 [Phanerochaete carnosa HHB-10118-sp]
MSEKTGPGGIGLIFAQACKAYFQLTRLHKFPLGNILVIWPCMWGATMAAYKAQISASQLVTQVALFVLGGTLVHSAACIINDICDIEFDRKVERTKNRPLAAGLIPVSGAWKLLSVMTIGCFAFLSLANSYAAFIGIFGVFPFHTLYPMMKRWTWWPQAWLGVAMNWGFLVAWLSVNPHYTEADIRLMLVMLIGMIFWTLVYDTEYACQDRRDNVKAGVKLTALLFGSHVREVLVTFSVTFLACLVLGGILNGQTAVYFVFSCRGAALHFAWQFLTWDINDPADCGVKFKSNGDLGYLVWAGLLLDYLMKM